MAERVESAIEMQLKPVLQRKLFCIGTIFFSLFSLLLLIDFPIFILFSIGLWRLYFAGRVDYSEIRISKALSWMVTCCFCGIIMLELTAVHWGLQIQLATKAGTPYRGIMQTNAACLPLFYMLILGLVTAYRAKKRNYQNKAARHKLACARCFVFSVCHCLYDEGACSAVEWFMPVSYCA